MYNLESFPSASDHPTQVEQQDRTGAGEGRRKQFALVFHNFIERQDTEAQKTRQDKT